MEKPEGKWHGIPIEYKIGVGILKDAPEFNMYWGKPFIGEERQVIQVTSDDHTWMMDNEDGSGIQKVIDGGWPQLGHRGVDVEDFREIPIEEWNMKLNIFKKREIERLSHEYWAKHNPKEHARMQSLEQGLKDRTLRGG